MAPWRFSEYVTDEEPRRCPIIEWYGTLDDDVKVAFDLLVKELSETDDWDEPKPSKRKYRELKQEHTGLCELLFKVGKRQFRPLGVRRVEAREFVFLGGCEKAGRGRTTPDDAFNSALHMKEALEAGRGASRDYTF